MNQAPTSWASHGWDLAPLQDHHHSLPRSSVRDRLPPRRSKMTAVDSGPRAWPRGIHSMTTRMTSWRLHLDQILAGLERAQKLTVFAALNLAMVQSIDRRGAALGDVTAGFYNAKNCLYVKRSLRQKDAEELMSRGVQLADLFDVLPRKQAEAREGCDASHLQQVARDRRTPGRVNPAVGAVGDVCSGKVNTASHPRRSRRCNCPNGRRRSGRSRNGPDARSRRTSAC